MAWLEQLDLERFLLFTLVLTRVSGLTMTAPVYGTKDVPMQVRALFAVALALLITPGQWHVTVRDPATMINYLVLLGSELLVGLCLGLGVMILFTGIQLAGQMMGRVSGMMLANVFDPSTEAEVPTFSRMLFMVTLAVFLCIGGHRLVMAGLLDTFQEIPPGSFPPWQAPAVPTAPAGGEAFQDTIAGALTTLLTESFRLGIRAAVPVVTAVLLSTLVMGLISRTMPQLNILMVGFGLNSMITYGILSITLGAAVWVFQEQIEPLLGIIFHALRAPMDAGWVVGSG